MTRKHVNYTSVHNNSIDKVKKIYKTKRKWAITLTLCNQNRRATGYYVEFDATSIMEDTVQVMYSYSVCKQQ